MVELKWIETVKLNQNYQREHATVKQKIFLPNETT